MSQRNYFSFSTVTGTSQGVPLAHIYSIHTENSTVFDRFNRLWLKEWTQESPTLTAASGEASQTPGKIPTFRVLVPSI